MQDEVGYYTEHNVKNLLAIAECYKKIYVHLLM